MFTMGPALRASSTAPAASISGVAVALPGSPYSLGNGAGSPFTSTASAVYVVGAFDVPGVSAGSVAAPLASVSLPGPAGVVSAPTNLGFNQVEGIAWDGTNIWLSKASFNELRRYNVGTNAGTDFTKASNIQSIWANPSTGAVWYKKDGTQLSRLNTASPGGANSFDLSMSTQIIDLAFVGTSILVTNAFSNVITKITSAFATSTIAFTPSPAPSNYFLETESNGVDRALVVMGVAQAYIINTDTLAVVSSPSDARYAGITHIIYSATSDKYYGFAFSISPPSGTIYIINSVTGVIESSQAITLPVELQTGINFPQFAGRFNDRFLFTANYMIDPFNDRVGLFGIDLPV